jgi:hypothetical protein
MEKQRVIEDLKRLTVSLEAFIKTLDGEKTTTKKEPITIEKVRAVLAEKSQSGKQAEVKALITKFGAKKLTDIDPEKYEDLLKEAEVL